MSDRFVRTLKDDDARALAVARMSGNCPVPNKGKRTLGCEPYARELCETLFGAQCAHTTGVVYTWRDKMVGFERRTQRACHALSRVLDAPDCCFIRNLPMYDVSRSHMLAASFHNATYVMGLSASGAPVSRVNLVAPQALRWSDDGEALYAGDALGAVRVFDAATSTQKFIIGPNMRALRAGHGAVHAMAQCGKQVAIGTRDRVRMTDLRQGPRYSAILPVAHGFCVTKLATSGNGNFLAASTDGDGVHVVDLRVMKRYAHVMPGCEVDCVAWSPTQAGALVCASTKLRGPFYNYGAHCLDVRTTYELGNARELWRARTSAPVSSVSWVAGVVTLFTGARRVDRFGAHGAPDTVLSLVDACTGLVFNSTKNAHDRSFGHCAFSPDGGVTVLACSDREALYVYKSEVPRERSEVQRGRVKPQMHSLR
jgi:hypothetical protein